MRRVDKPGRTVARLSGAIARVGFGLALAIAEKVEQGVVRKSDRVFCYMKRVQMVSRPLLLARYYILGNVVEAPPTPRSFACELE